MENTEVKILWDFNVETHHVIAQGQPHILAQEKKEKKALLIDIAVPGDVRAEEEEEKVMKYQHLAVTISKSRGCGS